MSSDLIKYYLLHFKVVALICKHLRKIIGKLGSGLKCMRAASP